MKLITALLIIVCAVGIIAAQTSQTDEATRLSAHAVKLFNEKKYKEAVPVAERVVRLREQEFGAQHFKTGEALRNLGFIQIANGDKSDAEKTLEKAVAIYEASAALTADSETQLAQMLETVAFYKFESRRIEKATGYYQKAAALREKINGPDALEIVPPLWALGNLYQFQKDFQNAEKMYRRVFEIRAKKLDKSSWETQEAEDYYYCMAVRNDNGGEAQNLIKSLNQPPSDADTSRLPDVSVKYIKGGVVNGKATNLAKPAYPAEARAKNAGGAVNVQVTINEAGKVIFACAFSGNKLLYEAVEYAAYQSAFAPTTLSGKPVKVTGIIVYNFVP